MQIFILIEQGRTITLLVEENDKISDIKKKIEKIHDIPQYRQILILNCQTLQDDKTLFYYKIKNKYTLSLCLGPPKGIMKIFIKRLTNNIFSLDVEYINTIHNLKDKIYEKEGFPQESQRIIYEGKSLESDRTLYDYNIKEGKTIYLLLRV